jgi:uncharacterized membrane protein YhaH (DUF805 family)
MIQLPSLITVKSLTERTCDIGHSILKHSSGISNPFLGNVPHTLVRSQNTALYILHVAFGQLALLSVRFRDINSSTIFLFSFLNVILARGRYLEIIFLSIRYLKSVVVIKAETEK